MRNRLIAFAVAVAALLGVVGYVVAQTIPVPQVTTVNPNNDLIQVVPNGSPGAAEVYAVPALVTNVAGYYKSIPTTNNVYTFGTNVSYAAFRPAGTLAAMSVYLAANPSDGARNCMFTTQTVTSFNVFANNANQSINSAILAAALSANTIACYTYGASNATWDRSN